MLTSGVAVSVTGMPGRLENVGDRERCSVDAATLAAIGRDVGHQVRVRRGPTELALYTIREALPENPPHTVRMSRAGRERLRADGDFDATVDPRVTGPAMTDADAKAAGELVERLVVDGGHLIAIAPHGGDIERHTDRQAEWVRAALPAGMASSWTCLGWCPGGGAYDRWHIRSTQLEPACFPLLGTVAERDFASAVAFHGCTGPDIIVGGRAAADLRKAVVAAIRRGTAGSGLEVRLSTAEDRLGASDPRNIVNRLTADCAHGVQIEQPLRARRDYGRLIAEAVAGVYRTY